MDGLVAKKFDLKCRQILREEDDALHKIQGDFSSRGRINSGVYLKHVFKTALVRAALNTIDALLESYEQVGWTTDEVIAVSKEAEILEEIQKVAVREQNRIKTKISTMAQNIGMPDVAKSPNADLLTEAKTKAEIFVETAKRKLQNAVPKKSFTDEAFLIMQIGDPQLDRIWSNVYVPVIQDFKLKPRRIDKHNEGRFLMSEVADLLVKSKIIIADLTNARPNCYLEVGYTYGIEKHSHLILCAREDHNPNSPNHKKDGSKIHFDISGYDIVFWDENKMDEFKIELAKKIKYRLTVVEK